MWSHTSSFARRRGRSTFTRVAAYTGHAVLALLLTGATPAAHRPAGVSGPPLDAAMATLHARLEGWKRGAGGVQVLDSLLAQRIALLRATAPSFERAWQELEATRIPVIVGTRDQLDAYLPRPIRESDGWVGVTVSWGGTSGLDRSAVAIRVDWLRRLHARYGNSDAAFLAALDDLIIHEIYGHLVPVVERRNAAYSCPDPKERERLADSCVGRRELALRAERETRTQYALP